MESHTIFKFFIPIAILSSIVVGPAYNLLVFLNTQILESHWSIYINEIAFANLMTLSFILFAVLFIISMRFVDKLTKEPFMIAGIIVLAFSSIYAGLIWVWEIVILTYIMSGATLAFLIPVITKYTSNKVQKEYENGRYILILPFASILWIAISFTLFAYIGESTWRLLYFIFGGINILAAIIVSLQ